MTHFLPLSCRMRLLLHGTNGGVLKILPLRLLNSGVSSIISALAPLWRRVNRRSIVAPPTATRITERSRPAPRRDATGETLQQELLSGGGSDALQACLIRRRQHGDSSEQPGPWTDAQSDPRFAAGCDGGPPERYDTPINPSLLYIRAVNRRHLQKFEKLRFIFNQIHKIKISSSLKSPVSRL